MHKEETCERVDIYTISQIKKPVKAWKAVFPDTELVGV
jgi:hypothetical protein